MNKTITFKTAHVAQPNTPETDLLEYVDHFVESSYDDGSTLKSRVSARCPSHAIELVSNQQKSSL